MSSTKEPLHDLVSSHSDANARSDLVRPAMASVVRAFNANAGKQVLAQRQAIKLELEAELRGLIMAARMHGFRVSIEGAAMDYFAVDTRLPGPSESLPFLCAGAGRRRATFDVAVPPISN